MDDEADMDSDGAAEDDAEFVPMFELDGAGLAYGTATHAESVIPAAISANAVFNRTTAGSTLVVQTRPPAVRFRARQDAERIPAGDRYTTPERATTSAPAAGRDVVSRG